MYGGRMRNTAEEGLASSSSSKPPLFPNPPPFFFFFPFPRVDTLSFPPAPTESHSHREEEGGGKAFSFVGGEVYGKGGRSQGLTYLKETKKEKRGSPPLPPLWDSSHLSRGKTCHRGLPPRNIVLGLCLKKCEEFPRKSNPSPEIVSPAFFGR